MLPRTEREHEYQELRCIYQPSNDARRRRKPGQPDRGMTMRQGEFYWQDAGITRAIRNIGTTRLELVEFELKKMRLIPDIGER
jgi:hypothetical protein